MNLFVNLPLRYIHNDTVYLDFFIEHRLQPELGLDVIAIEHFDHGWHRSIAAALQQAHLACAIHFPFFDLQPGSIDNGILQATRHRLVSACAVAKIYSPCHLIAHAGFTDVYDEFYEEWLNRSKATWQVLGKEWPDHPPIYLENVYEETYHPIADVLARINNPGFGSCFDTGHWYSFSQGARLKNLEEWITGLAGYVRHLHLHDNDGSFDQHRGLGQGSVPWEELFTVLRRSHVWPSITLEPHSREGLEHSLAFINKHPEWFPLA
ncbi:MAG: sugar phosphate isomerase/epimerase [Desulfobacterota bacterium]|nr:sugar phosphate isomerase/epimerase [Thermodesulfobacteriota bacterium]